MLGSHFPTSSINFLLQNSSLKTPTDLSCFDVSPPIFFLYPSIHALQAGKCSIGSHNVRGFSTLKALLLPGSYTLYFFDTPYYRNTSINTCSPFTMQIQISPAAVIEDFLNCQGMIMQCNFKLYLCIGEGEEFPSTLQEPGKLDGSGFVYFREDIAIDLETPIYKLNVRIVLFVCLLKHILVFGRSTKLFPRIYSRISRGR